MPQNLIFSYAVVEDNNGFYVQVTDLEGASHDVCFCESEKVAEHIAETFDNMAMQDEADLLDLDFEACEGCGSTDLPCSCDEITRIRSLDNA